MALNPSNSSSSEQLALKGLNWRLVYSTQGDTLVPLHYELPVTLLLEHIPLAATDYFVARCRREYTTTVESVCGIVRLTFIFLRLIW